MSKIIDFLHKAGTFYHASVDGNEARVRPINSVISYKDKIYFETSNKKDMYRQMIENPSVAITAMADGQWIRITGKAVMDDSEEAKNAMFEMIPELESVYSFEELAPYYLKDIKATLYSFDQDPIILED